MPDPFGTKRLAARDGEKVRRCGLTSLSGAIRFVAPPTLPGFPGGGPCGCTVMRVSISSVFAPAEGGVELLPVGNESGECAAELVALASFDGCGAASSAAALVAKAAAKASVSVKEPNFSFRPLIVMSRSFCRLRALGAAGAIFATKEHDLNGRYNNQKDDRTDEHSPHDDRCERLLHLAADAR